MATTSEPPALSINPSRDAAPIIPASIASVSRRVRVNSVWLLVTRLVVQVQLALFTVLAARSLGAAGFGQYAFVASTIFLVNVFTTFGTDTLLIRILARTHSAREPVLASALWIQLALSAISIVILLPAADVLSDKTPDTLLALKLYSLSLIPMAFYGIFTAVLRAFERMDLFLAANLIAAIAQLGGAWLVLHEKPDVVSLILMLALVQVVAAALAGGMCRRFIPDFVIRWRVTRRDIADTLRVVWPLALLSALAVVYQRIGVMALSLQAGDTPTGWFSAATRIIEPLKLLHFAVLGALFPALAHLAGREGSESRSRHDARRLFRASFVLLLGAGSAAALLVTWVADPLVVFLYGAEFTPAASAVRVLAWSLIPYTLSASLSLRLITRGQDRRVLAATALGLAAALALNLWLIPLHGLTGASWAVLGSECVQAVAFLALRRAS